MFTPGTPGPSTPRCLYENRSEEEKRQSDVDLSIFMSSRNVVRSQSFTNPNRNNDRNGSAGEKPPIKVDIPQEYLDVLNDDVDDSEELFNKVLERVERDAEYLRELREKNPNFSITDNYFLEQSMTKSGRKTKKKPQTFTKPVEKALQIMNNYRANLQDIENNERSNDFSLSSTSNKKPSKVISVVPKNVFQGIPNLKINYPIWKTTENNIPIFTATSNPRWKNIGNKQLPEKNFTPLAQKLYTPRQAIDRVNDANCNDPSSTICKSQKTITSILKKDKNNKVDNFNWETLGNPIGMSTPKIIDSKDISKTMDDNNMPLFTATSNPRWKNIGNNDNQLSVEKNITSLAKKLYTPRQMTNWVNDVNINPPSTICKNQKTITSILKKDKNNKVENFNWATLGNPIGMSTEEQSRKSVVRFQDVPKEKFFFKKTDVSSYTSSAPDLINQHLQTMSPMISSKVVDPTFKWQQQQQQQKIDKSNLQFRNLSDEKVLCQTEDLTNVLSSTLMLPMDLSVSSRNEQIVKSNNEIESSPSSSNYNYLQEISPCADENIDFENLFGDDKSLDSYHRKLCTGKVFDSNDFLRNESRISSPTSEIEQVEQE